VYIYILFVKMILVDCLLRYDDSLSVEEEQSCQNKNCSPVNIVGISRVEYCSFFVLHQPLVNSVSRLLSVVKLLLISG